MRVTVSFFVVFFSSPVNASFSRGNLWISTFYLFHPCWTLLLLVGNTDCVNLLRCSLWPLNIVANKLHQNIDCVSLSRFEEQRHSARLWNETSGWKLDFLYPSSLIYVVTLSSRESFYGSFATKIKNKIKLKKNSVRCCIKVFWDFGCSFGYWNKMITFTPDW